MPKYRQLHTRILQSFDFNEIPNDFIRVVWLLLPLILDGEGRGIYNTSWIKSKMFPMRDNITDEMITSAFDWLAGEKRKMVIIYSANDHQYFFVPTFKDYQSGTDKEAKSVLPDPNINKPLPTYSGVTPDLLRSYSVPYESESESESESVNESVPIDQTQPIKDLTIFKLYENNIEMITPMMKDKLIDAANTYPLEWIQKAIEIAVERNARNWRYITAILKRWQSTGYDAGKQSGATKGHPKNCHCAVCFSANISKHPDLYGLTQ